MNFDNIVRDTMFHTGEFGCGCSACAGGMDPRLFTDSPEEASLDPRAGETANNKPIWTVEQVAAHLNRSGGGFANGGGTFSEAKNGKQNNIGDDGSVITFGFFENQTQLLTNGYGYTALNAQGVLTNYALGEFFNFASFNEAQRAATRESMQYWDDLIATSFRETNADDADMNFGNLANAPDTQAYARIPTASLDATLAGQVREIGGDSWYSLSQASNLQLDEGLYGMNTLTHEIGHALGLSHPGSYNFGPGFSVNYANGAEYAQDARNYSIMSYWNPRDLGSTPTGVVTRDFDWSLMAIAYGATPMVHDIAAIQAIYGADMTTRTGDTVYGFNSNAGRDAFDFNLTPWPTMAIWDAGGNDTLDASGYNVNQNINLTPGSLSSIGGVTYEEALAKLTFEQVNANRAAAGYAPTTRATYDANMAALALQPDFRGRLTDNVGIAYGATIENAVGGSGNDEIIGNAAANRLTGNAGADTMLGGAAADTLAGGAGDDVLAGGAGADVLDGGDGFDFVSYRDSATAVTVTATGRGFNVAGTTDNAGDVLTGIEGAEGSRFADTMNGSSAADGLRGFDGDDRLSGFIGADTLSGGNGADLLDGGNDGDLLNGDAGADRLVGGNGFDVLNGGADADTLEGGNDGDTLNGGAGDDRLTGGTGSDTFRFSDAAGTDTITDFRRGADKLDLGGIDANTAAAGDQAFTFVSGGAFTKVAGQLISGQANGANFLAGDVNGDGVADFTIFTGSVQLDQTDIAVI